MAQLTDYGRQVVADLSQRLGVSQDAVETMARAVSQGNGTMAQFYHPEFGGSGQWMQGGMTMVSDLFNTALKMNVENVCNAVAQAMYNGQMFTAEPGDMNYQWWPADLGQPSSVGGQNDALYAVFPQADRLAVQRNGMVEIYDLAGHNIGGVSQQQDGMGTRLTFSSQYGQFDVSSLRRVDANAPQPAPEPMQQQPAPSPDPVQEPVQQQQAPAQPSSMSSDDALAKLERLAALVEKGMLTDEEFSAKKADLLSRI